MANSIWIVYTFFNKNIPVYTILAEISLNPHNDFRPGYLDKCRECYIPAWYSCPNRTKLTSIPKECRRLCRFAMPLRSLDLTCWHVLSLGYHCVRDILSLGYCRVPDILSLGFCHIRYILSLGFCCVWDMLSLSYRRIRDILSRSYCGGVFLVPWCSWWCCPPTNNNMWWFRVPVHLPFVVTLFITLLLQTII